MEKNRHRVRNRTEMVKLRGKSDTEGHRDRHRNKSVADRDGGRGNKFTFVPSLRPVLLPANPLTAPPVQKGHRQPSLGSSVTKSTW